MSDAGTPLLDEIIAMALPKAAAKQEPFVAGAEQRVVLAPRWPWSFSVNEVQATVSPEVEMSITSVQDLLEEDVYIFRPQRAEGQRSCLDLFCRDLAVVDQDYVFQAYGDGTATLKGLSILSQPALSSPATIYLPGPRYEDEGAFSPQNAGCWRVERVHPSTQTLYLRRIGSQQSGVTETVKAKSRSDIQSAMSCDHAAALLVGFISGVFPVIAATQYWVAVRMPHPIPETPSVNFETFAVTDCFMGRCLLETDQTAKVSFNGGTGVVVSPQEPGVEAEMSRYEVTGFITTLEVENLSTQPMKLRLNYKLGK